MITARPVRTEDAASLAALFESASNRCHCRYLHFDGDKNDWLMQCSESADTNRRELDEAIRLERDDGLGVVALEGEAIVGWLKVAPVAAVRKAYEQRFYRGMDCFRGDRSGVFLLACALVRPDRRKRGIATAMVRAAIELARSRGACAVEALPRRPRDAVSDEELWTIPVAALEDNGLTVVGGEDPYPVLRIDLTP